MKLEGKTVLITGGAGQIGSNLAKTLISCGARVKIADNLWRGSLDYLLDDGEDYIIDIDNDFINCDLRLLENCQKCVKGVDIVFHLADIVAGIDYVFDNQPFVYRSNVLINSNMLHAASQEGVENFVYTSAACSYPHEKQNDPNHPPFKEEDMYPANPESAYGWSKLMGEYECELYSKQSLLNVSILRLHNVYGPHCDLSPERSQVIPSLIRKAIRYPAEKFIVWGNGKQSRAFVYVSDIVDALLLAVEKGINKGPIQIGIDKKTTIDELSEIIIDISGKKIPIEHDLSKPVGDIGRAADINKAREILGWSPKTPIEEGIRRTYEWAFRYLKVHGKI